MPVKAQRPPIPPAKDPNVPRPHKDVKTEDLLRRATKVQGRISELEERLRPLRDERMEYLLELERRQVSYRAMATHLGSGPGSLSNVQISRLMRKYHDGKPPVV